MLLVVVSPDTDSNIALAGVGLKFDSRKGSAVSSEAAIQPRVSSVYASLGLKVMSLFFLNP